MDEEGIKGEKLSVSATDNANSRKSFGLFYLIGVLIVLLYGSWPYYSLYTIRNALESGDVVVLDQKFDWPDVRSSLKSSVNSLMARSVAEQAQSDKSSSSAIAVGIMTLFGPAIVEKLVDAYVTPQGIAQLVARSGKIDLKSPGSASDSNSSVTKSDEKENLDIKNIRYAFFDTPFRFRLVLGEPGSNSEKQLTIILELIQMDWKVTRLFLPIGN